MMSRAVWRLATTLSAAAVLSVATAQSPIEDEPEPPAPLYRIEVIVFAYNEADPSEERFRARPAAADPQPTTAPESDLATFDFESMTAPELIDLTARGDSAASADGAAGGPLDAQAAGGPEGATAAAGDDAPQAPLDDELGVAADGGSDAAADADADAASSDPVDLLERRASSGLRFRILGADELKMGGAYDRLQRVDAYTPLLHGGWIQEGLPENEARPFDLAYLGTLNPLGTIQLRLSRFLHLTLDLDYRLRQNAGLPTAASSQPFGLSELSVGPRYPLNAERRIRSREMNYFDHPFFGVLVTVEPFEPEPEASSDAEGPAA